MQDGGTMNPIRYLRALLVAFVLFVLLDAFWHGGIMAGFYNQRLTFINPAIVGTPIGFSPFILFVAAINAVALSYFILSHIEDGKPMANAAWIGALLGFTVTATVNFLNHVLIPRWDIVLALVDTAWGTAAGIIGALAVATVCAEKKRGWFGWLRRGE